MVFDCTCLNIVYLANRTPRCTGPPLVNLCTTGNGTVRFNPNLYNCGKVCLSLLGTWSGEQGENWNPQTSTLLQVLVSIQSLILVPRPYFNEPSYEKQMGTPDGDARNAAYNAEVQKNNIKFGMLAQLKNPHPHFEEVIVNHFFMKKRSIMAECRQWVKDAGKGTLPLAPLRSAL